MAESPQSPASTRPNADPRFQYQDIGPSSISVVMWDKIAASVFDPTTGSLGLIKALALASFAALYVIVREKLIAAQQEMAKQKYEVGQSTQNQVDIDQDDLSGEKNKK